MKKISILCAVLAVLTVIGCSGLFSAFAETLPVEDNPTQPVVTNPVVSEPATVPTTVPVTDPATAPTDNTVPTGDTQPTAGYTEPATEVTRPTEYDEDNQPSTYSDYVSPAPIYTPADQDFQENEWEEIELDIDSEANVGGVGDFSNIKNNTAKGDEKSPLLLVLCIVFWCLALSCLTFVILYKPKTGKTAKAGVRTASGKSTQAKHSTGGRRSSDDYNDGY